MTQNISWIIPNGRGGKFFYGKREYILKTVVLNKSTKGITGKVNAW